MKFTAFDQALTITTQNSTNTAGARVTVAISRTYDSSALPGVSPSELRNCSASTPNSTAAARMPTVFAVLFRPRLRARRILIRSSTKPTAPSAVASPSTSQPDADGPLPSITMPTRLRAQVSRPDARDDRDAAHRRCAALLVVARRPVLADLVPEPLPGEQPDQHRRQKDRYRQRDADGDEDLPHPRNRPVGDQCVGQGAEPGRVRGFHQHHVSGLQFRPQQCQRGVGVGDHGGLGAPRPLHDRPVVHGAHRPPGSDDDES